MHVATGDELLRACSILFGSDVNVSADFLSYIQPSGVKSAFRKKALETHPDRLSLRKDAGKEKSAERFIETTWAYRSLLGYISRRDRHTRIRARAASKPRTGKRPMTPPQKAEQSRGSYHRGSLPRRRLLLGQYLFYAGEIPWEVLIRAIIWQRSQRPRLGDIAKKWGWLTETEIRDIIKTKRLGENSGEALVRLNLLSSVQLNILLYHQRKLQRPFGEFFVLNNHITRDRLDRLLREFTKHNDRPPGR